MDIHRLSSSLEFRHLMDVIEIGQREELNGSATLAVVSYRESKQLSTLAALCADQPVD